MSEQAVFQGGDSGLAGLIRNYRRLSAQSVPLVLATVVETLGSTYRKAGARMLIGADGGFYGLIGGGCFEGDLHEQARPVFETGEPRLLFYDMRAPEDALWGLGLGCNGAVRILLQRLRADGNDPTIALMEDILKTDASAVMATLCSGSLAGASYLLQPLHAEDAGPPAEYRQQMQAEARSTAVLGQPTLITHELDGRELSVFYDYIRPAPRLLMIGAGADAVPVLNLASQLGWRVMLVDHRPAYAVAERFPGAEAVVLAQPPELLATVGSRRIDAAVLMTHNIDYDARFLAELYKLPCRYLGLLGPAARRDRLFGMSGLDPEAFATRLHGPVGLDIGGGTPESIALSLVTEIHAVLHERDARPLHGKHEPIQTRPTAN